MDGYPARAALDHARDPAETLTQLLESVAAARPDAMALRHGEQTVTWREFLQRSRRLAAGLAARGFVPGERLAVWLPSVPDYLILCFAAWRLGLVVVSLNPRFRQAELDPVLSSQRPVAIAFSAAEGSVEAAAILGGLSREALSALRLLILQQDDAQAPFRAPAPLAGAELAPLPALEGEEECREDRAHGEAPAVTFTTSGTTSRPKIVLHRHSAIVGHAGDVATEFGFREPGALLLEVMPLAAAYGFNQSLGAIAGGACQILMPQFDAPEAARLLREERVTHLLTTNDLVNAVLRQATEERPYPSLRACACSLFNPSLRHVLDEAAARGIPLYMSYGSTETQAFALTQRLGDSLHLRARPGGFPASPQTAIRLRDTASGALVGPGQPGLLEMRGPSIMAGYDGDPEATAAAFTEDGWLRTGDVGTIEPDGSFHFLTRADDALRLGGFLIHPAEIERLIERHPGVLAAKVVGAQGQRGTCTVAFVRPAVGARLEEAALRAWCAQVMAWFKVPDRIVAVDDFPVVLAANGTKVRNGELRAMAQRLLDASASDAARRLAEAPAGEIAAMQARIAAIWAEELEVLRVDPEADFLDLGGDSLAAVRIVHAVETAFDRALPASAVGALTTVRDMLRLVLESPAAAPAEQQGTPAAGLTPSERRLFASVMAIGAIPLAHTGATMKLVHAAGTGRPMFWCVNSPAVEIPALADMLGPESPIYGLYSGGMLLPDDEETIARTARHYAEEILALGSAGPCIVGGICRGGRVAARLAPLLAAAGRPVEALCLIEHAEPGLADWPARMLLLFGRQSALRAWRAIGWPRRGWQAGFRGDVTAAWIEGDHGQVFAPRHRAGLGRVLRAFLAGGTEAPGAAGQRRDAWTAWLHRLPGALPLWWLGSRLRGLGEQGRALRLNPFTGEKRRYTASVLVWIARRRLRGAIGRP